MLKVYIREGCSLCEQVEIPDGVKVENIDINKGYSGFHPANTPVIQIDGINFEGPMVINSLLKLIKQSSNGEYSK